MFHLGNEIVQRHSANVLGIHPERLVVSPMLRVILMKVKNCIGPSNVFKREVLHQFLFTQNLFAFRWRPAKQSQEVSKCRRHKATIAVSRERDNFTVFSLRQLSLVGRKNQWQMRKLRDWRAQRFIDQHLLMSIG